MRLLEIILIIILAFTLTMSRVSDHSKHNYKNDLTKITKTEQEWKKILTEQEFMVTRLGIDEQPNTGEFHAFFEQGTYHCICCDNLLFNSTAKFRNGCGYATFNSAINNANIKLKRKIIKGRYKTQVKCIQCNAHLGYVTNDGPPPAGLRYCINSTALHFNAQYTKTKKPLIN